MNHVQQHGQERNIQYTYDDVKERKLYQALFFPAVKNRENIYKSIFQMIEMILRFVLIHPESGLNISLQNYKPSTR
jgi:hypothetical protein